MQREAITSAKIAPAVGPFSAGMLAQPQVFLSGQVGQDPATGSLVEGGVVAQARQAFTNIMSVLDDVGRTAADVVRVGVYLTDMSDFAEVNKVYSEFFRAPYPARTAIAVAALPLGALVEADVMAV